MELNQYIEGYQYVKGTKQLALHHKAAIQFVVDKNLQKINQDGNIDCLIEQLHMINREHKNCAENLEVKDMTEFGTVTFLASTKIYPAFLKQYHHTVFICLVEKERDWKKYINDDCQIIEYPLAKCITKKEGDGMLLYTIYQYLKEWKIKNVNIFANSFNYYKSLCDVLQYNSYTTQYIQASKQTNAVIDKIKGTKSYPETIEKLRTFILQIDATLDCETIINSIFKCGYAFYDKDNNINYIREFL